jgi:hypothetical protein
LIDTPSGQTATLDGSTASGAVTNLGNYFVRSASTTTMLGTINNGGAIIVENGSTLQESGTLNNTGKVFLSSTGAATTLNLTGNTTLTGGGTISLSNSAQNLISGFGTLTNVNNTIEGAGTIEMFTNTGTLNANQSTPLTVNFGEGGTNNGTMEATKGGTLVVTVGATGNTLDNTGGEIIAGSSSNVVLTGGIVIQNGSLVTSPGGQMQTAAGQTTTLNGTNLINAGTYIQQDNSTTQLAGTILNTGTINLASSGDVTQLALTGTTTFAGGGTIVMSNNANNRIGPTTAAPFLTSLINVNNVIEGAGNIFVSGGEIINQGTINANQSAPLRVSFGGGSGNNVNTGTLEATNGGTLELNGGEALPVNNKGGTIFAGDQSEVQLINNLDIQGGTLTTAGQGVIVVPSGNNSASSTAVTLDGITQGTLTNAGNLVLEDNSTANVLGTINNTGSIILNGASNPTVLQLAGNTTLTGGGSVFLSNGTSNLITDTGAGFTLTNADNLIEGNGAFDVGTLVNGGTIKAGQGELLGINIASTFTNSGTLVAATGSLLVLNGGTFNNFSGGTLAGGTYEVDAFNSVSKTQGTATLKIGELPGFSGGEITTLVSSIFGNTSVILNGTNAVITDSSGKNALALATIGSGASLTLENGASMITPGNLLNVGSVEIGSTVNGAPSTLQTGSIGLNNYAQTAGSTKIDAGGILSTTRFNQTGGLTEVDGTLGAPQGVDLNGGQFTGSGLVIGNVFNNGATVEPIDPTTPSTLTIAGNYTQISGGTLRIDVGGTSPGQFSVLDVLGNASLGGAVDLVGVNGFEPVIGDDFTFLLVGGSVSGDFSNIDFTNFSCPVDATCEDVLGPGSFKLEIESASSAPTPEPSNLLLLGTGLVALALAGQRKSASGIGFRR